MEVQKELKHQQLMQLLAAGKRADGRSKHDYRDIQITRDVLGNAEGSALCTIGKTQVICGVKVSLATPFPDRPNEGVLSTGAEFTPLGSHLFEPGPPKVEAIELARVVDRGIRSANMVDLASLSIPGSSKVKAVYVDLWIADHDGNLFDAAMLAAVAALSKCRMPKIENEKIAFGEYAGNLPVSCLPVSCTFGAIGGQHLLDPTLDEEKGVDGLFVLATTPDFVCAAQKSGWMGYTQKDIMEFVDISFKKGAELRRLLEQ
ncbi:Exosome complex component Rrp42 [uncultured archaeon]|nr:Exosome complex component Rrp42 [uncultured archaeon]